jgi:DNA-binding CsgD family transcriptional regulator
MLPKAMNSNKKMLHATWNRLSDVITRKNIDMEGIRYDEVMASIFSPGPYYFYIVDFYDRQIKQISPEIQSILGLDPQTVTFDDILSQIHPDDIGYVTQAEATVLNYLYNSIGREKVTQYKMSYCFRFKTADGSYQLFQHQSIILTTDELGGFAKALNIHTNINHLTTNNNHKATITGILGQKEFIEIDISTTPRIATSSMLFTRRETEIIHLIAKGIKSEDIAGRLSIALNTVKNHRKNITRKAGVKSSSELIAKCLNEGLI